MPNFNTKSAEMRALVCATVVAYARPFTKSQVTEKERVIPLSGINPPSELSSVHTMVLKLRDKVMGHKDAIPAKGDTSTPNIVLLHRDPIGFNLHTIVVEGMTDTNQTDLKTLCSFFITHCEQRIRPLIDRYGSEIMKVPLGLHQLVVTEAPNEWIKPFNPIIRREA